MLTTPCLGFDLPLPSAGAAVRRSHWSTDGLRALIVPDGSRSVRVYDRVRDLFTPIGDGSHGPQIPTASGLIGFTTVSDVVQIASDSSRLLSTSRVTLLLVRRKMDSTARAACHIGVDDDPGTLVTRCNAYVPYSDGTVKWTFGGSTDGTTKVTISGLTFTPELPEAWAFVAGQNGMAVYLNGVCLGSHTTPASRTAATEQFTLNQGGTSGVTGDLTEVSFVAVLDAEWNAQQVQEWSQNQAVMFAPAFSRRRALMAEPPPGVFTVTLDGADITDAIRVGDRFVTPELDFQRGTPGRFTFDIETETPPARGLEVIAWNKTGTTRAFGGIVESATPIVFGPGVSKCYHVEALKFDRYFDYFYWTKRYEDPVTPLQILRDMWADKDLESEYGLVLDEDVAEGDPIDASESKPIEFTNAKGTDVIKKVEDYCLAAEDPRVGVTSPRKKFSLNTPGAVTSPVTIRTTDLNFSDFRVSPSKQIPANTVIGEFGTAGQGASTIYFSWLVPGVVPSSFAITGDANAVDGDNIPSAEHGANVIIVDGTSYPMWGPGEAPGGNGVEWDSSLNGGTATFVGTGLVDTGVIAGSLIEVNYTPKYPFTIELTNGGTPRIEARVVDTKVEHYAQGVLAAQAALAQLDQDVDGYEIDTLEDGIDLYQTLPIDVPEADAEDTEGIVTGLRALLHTADPNNPADGSFWEYTVTVERASGGTLQADSFTRERNALRGAL